MLKKNCHQVLGVTKIKTDTTRARFPNRNNSWKRNQMAENSEENAINISKSNHSNEDLKKHIEFSVDVQTKINEVCRR